jgi:hypothetical protein
MSEKPITRERLLRVLDGQAQKTAHTIAGLDEAALNRPARGDGWTAKEILGHMASGYEGMLALAEGRIPGEAALDTFNLDAHNQASRECAACMSLEQVLDWLAAARSHMRACIEQTDEAAFGELVHTPWMGDHPRGQFLMFPALHEGGHRVELEQWRTVIQGPPA